jgi:hypothetical protein
MPVVIDIELAKEVKKNRLRRQRKPLLEALDLQYMRASESNDSEKMAEIVAMKQALRDITSAAELINATTLEQIKQVSIPEELK